MLRVDSFFFNNNNNKNLCANCANKGGEYGSPEKFYSWSHSVGCVAELQTPFHHVQSVLLLMLIDFQSNTLAVSGNPEERLIMAAEVPTVPWPNCRRANLRLLLQVKFSQRVSHSAQHILLLLWRVYIL